MARIDYLASGFTVVAATLVGALAVVELHDRWVHGKTVVPAKRNAIEHVDDLRPTLAGNHVIGDQRAAIALVEFADFQCPYCGEYARDTFKHLQRRFIDTGRVRYIFRSFPLVQVHPQALGAARAAACAGDQNEFWPMHDLLFQRSAQLNDADLRRNAGTLHLDVQRFERCLQSRSAELLNDDIAEGHRLGVASTPTFFIGTVQPDGTLAAAIRIRGAQPMDVFQTAFESTAHTLQAQLGVPARESPSVAGR
jgi:protein-disulfide isomerase